MSLLRTTHSYTCQKIALAIILGCGAVFSPLGAEELRGEQQIAKRAYAHILIKDYNSALQEVQSGLSCYPQSEQLHEAKIKILAKLGDEQAMVAAWEQFVDLFPKDEIDRDILEAMAWGVIEKGAESQSPLTKIIAILAAFFSQDIKGVNILHDNLRNSNTVIRAVTVQLAGHMMDDKLKREMPKLLEDETVWSVRLEIIKALGSMKVLESKPALERIIADNKSMAEEKAAAISALVKMLETADREYVYGLAQSDRAGLRTLACEVVAALDLHRDIDLIMPLLNDSHAEVRSAALITLGVMRIPSFQDRPMANIAAEKINDNDAGTAILASWLLMLNDPAGGQTAIKPWLKHDSKDIRLNAAAALSAAGKYGLPLIQEEFNSSDDIYVKMNLGLALIAQRVNTKQACDVLYQGLCKEKERWMWEEEGPFSVVGPSKVKHQELIPQYPEAVNLNTRLKILNVLAVMRYEKAQQATKSFLKERSENISTVAAALLLTEGDEEAIDLVKELLADPNPKIRIQAALILSLWSHDDSSLDTLEKAYRTASREQKERIIEGLGHIGSTKSVPFLVERLKEPYQILRLIAASGLIQCLNQ